VFKNGRVLKGQECVFEKIKECSSGIFEVIELCSAEDVRDKEAFYLDKYKNDPLMISKYDQSWKPVLQYKEDGIFIKRHVSISSAARYSGFSLGKVQEVLNKQRKSYKGIVFVYENEYQDRRGQIIKERGYKREPKRGRDVLMLDIDGNTLNIFRKMTDAARFVGVRPESIARVICGAQKTAKGYMFKYGEDKPKKEKPFKINQYDTSGNFIKGYFNLSDAAKSVGVDRSYFRKRVLSSGSYRGYDWKIVN
jgi:hypothetical protein